MLVTAMVTVGLVAVGAAPATAESGTPGTVINYESLSTSEVSNASAIYLVEYWSETWNGKAVKVTGLIYVPEGTAPEGGWPVVSWAHPTVGLNYSCAPSLDPSTAVPEIDTMLAQGFEVVATDYQGMANADILSPSPSLLPYLVGKSAAYNTIDMVKAAVNMEAETDASDNYVVWGWSEGGQTAMFVLDYAKTYSAGLNLDGVLAMAPPSNLSKEIPYAEKKSTDWVLLFLAVGGWNSAYGNTAAPVSDMLTAHGQKYLPLLSKKGDCLDQVGSKLVLDSGGFDKVFNFKAGTAVSKLPAKWQTLIKDNDPSNAANLAKTDTSVPLIIANGTKDTVVDPATEVSLTNEMCALSTPQNVEHWLYTGLTHDNIDGSATIDDFVGWTANQFADAGPYSPSGTSDNPVTVTGCS